jgi:hypothetical protein
MEGIKWISKTMQRIRAKHDKKEEQQKKKNKVRCQLLFTELKAVTFHNRPVVVIARTSFRKTKQ